LTNAQSELLKAKQDAEGAFDLAYRIRAREEESKLRERQLERKARLAEEERRMADLVVSEYADLGPFIGGSEILLTTESATEIPCFAAKLGRVWEPNHLDGELYGRQGGSQKVTGRI